MPHSSLFAAISYYVGSGTAFSAFGSSYFASSDYFVASAENSLYYGMCWVNLAWEKAYCKLLNFWNFDNILF